MLFLSIKGADVVETVEAVVVATVVTMDVIGWHGGGTGL